MSTVKELNIGDKIVCATHSTGRIEAGQICIVKAKPSDWQVELTFNGLKGAPLFMGDNGLQHFHKV